MRAVTILLPIWIALLCSGCVKKQPALRWEPLPLGTDAAFEDIWFADSLNGWIAGGSYQIDGGLIGRTRDGGLTWDYSSGMFGSTTGYVSPRKVSVRAVIGRAGTSGREA